MWLTLARDCRPRSTSCRAVKSPCEHGCSKSWTRAIGERVGMDVGAVEFGWPCGMPLCRSLGDGLWEVRSNISSGRIARVLFAPVAGQMVLLHAFIKKTQRTPPEAIRLARRRLKEIGE